HDRAQGIRSLRWACMRSATAGTSASVIGASSTVILRMFPITRAISMTGAATTAQLYRRRASPSCVSPMDCEVGSEEEPLGSHPQIVVALRNEHPGKCHESHFRHRGHYGARIVVACVAYGVLGCLIRGSIRIGEAPNRSTYQLA